MFSYWFLTITLMNGDVMHSFSEREHEQDRLDFKSKGFKAGQGSQLMRLNKPEFVQ